ncbi:MAG: flagellar hook assembly protein FlgD [Gammaproteobacteria bacterium]
MDAINSKNPAQMQQMQATLDSLGLSKPKEGMKEQNLGQEDFMELMLAQMNHQDPFKPMENGDFIAQMAQFSSVKGLKEIKDSFNTLATSLQSSQALQASSMVGRSVLVPGNATRLSAGSDMNGAVEVPSSTSDLKVKVYDAGGQLVKTLDLGSQQEGVAHFSWDGSLDTTAPDGSILKANDGKYTVQAEMLTDDKPQALTTLITDQVQSVSLGKPGEPVTLHLATAGKTSLAEIKQIM